jgi:predicted DNA-binding antitoxin AbrB/MazE fold protein
MTMTLTIEATYENGVLRPSEPLPFREHERLRVAIVSGRSLAEQYYGLIGWQGDSAAFDRLYSESELVFWNNR